MSKKLNRAELESALISKAAADAEFRKQLTQNPREAIAACLGLEVPKELEITVFEESPQHLCLVLPSTTGGELADADLTGVAGGRLQYREHMYNKG